MSRDLYAAEDVLALTMVARSQRTAVGRLEGARTRALVPSGDGGKLRYEDTSRWNVVA